MASKRVISITDISSTGEGIGRLDGKVYFVHGAWPLQTVEVSILQEKPRYVRATISRLLEDTASSRPYLCPHTQCGACTLRYIPYQEQCLYKEQLLQNSFSKIAKEQHVLCNRIQAMPEQRQYRNKVEFHYGYTQEGKEDIGFYQENSHTIIPITHCAIVPPAMLEILTLARKQLSLSGISVYHNGTGFWRHLVIRHSQYSNRYMIHCITAPLTQYYHAVQHLFSALTEVFSDCICVHSVRKSPALLARGEQYITSPHEAYLLDTISLQNRTTTIRYGANSFFQNNHTMMTMLYSAIERLCRRKESYLDLCTGVGSIALSCFSNATHIEGIDSIAEAIGYAKLNARDNNIVAHFTTLDMRKLTRQHVHTINSICVDPPRGGLHPHVIDILHTSNIQYIIYISCNPMTMARDCSLLQKTYTILHSTPFDMFPHTVHCESLTLLEKR